jgi:hypothetical protein
VNNNTGAASFAKEPLKPTPGTPVVFAPFTKSDWYGMAGASRFADGSEPLVGGFAIDTSEVATLTEYGPIEGLVIIDLNGLHIDLIDVDGTSCRFVTFEPVYAARATALLRHGMSYADLIALPGATVES